MQRNRGAAIPPPPLQFKTGDWAALQQANGENGFQNASEALSDSLEFQNFLGDHAPRTAYIGDCKLSTP